MKLTGLPFLLLLCAVAAALMVVAYLLWNRVPRRLAPPVRVLSMVLLMVMGATIAADAVNREFSFYGSLSELFGRPTSAHDLAVVDHTPPDGGVTIRTADWQANGRRDALRGHGELLEVTYPGRRSGLSRPGLLYLPAAYFTGPPQRRFPAMEMLEGFPGSVDAFTNLLSLPERMDTEIAAGRVPPMLVVMPTTYEGSVSSECVDAVNGEEDETYLAVDVLDDVVSGFRVAPGRSWAATGISTGGFCAVNLALHHPERFATAASLSGFFTAGEDPGTAGLYRGARFAKEVNSPIWWIRHRTPVAPAIYLFASGGDPDAVKEATSMRATLAKYTRALPSQTVITPTGGHNWGVWSAAFAPALDWEAQFLPTALEPPLVQ